MKAILVIDMPTKCGDCPLHVDGLDDECEEIMMCNATHRESNYGAPPTWCPLKPLPETKDVGYPNNDYDVGFGDGWDACIKEITGETE